MNISREYFTEFNQITDRDGRPLVNIYWDARGNTGNDKMCLYMIHGYGGSPVEPCMKVPMQYARKHGYNIVAIEGVDMSATYGPVKDITTMTLPRQKQALSAGLKFCKRNPDLRASYNIAWVHSISCRALSDLVVDSPRLRNFFNEVVLNNPYFLPPPKVEQLRTRIMRRDPSGNTWREISRKSTVQTREIEGQMFKIPTCLYNLFIPVPARWIGVDNADLPAIAKKMATFVDKMHIHFVLGTADNMADYNQNMQFGCGLDIPNKEIISIQGANHSFENALDSYDQFSRVILDHIRQGHCIHQ